ncbi:low temperature requirement protein A [Deinococcus sonorensis]|uniref:Low temperature requirement protein A n=2 Tax=Deinococcus sonorensis TaxID=309891 RepID=A0AAU7U7Y7_9DEIO
MSGVQAAKAPTIERVGTLELFLDLVFVFTITQLSALVAHPHGPEGYARAALVLAVTWWIYSGYAWLTSNVRTDAVKHRLLIIGGMAGFLVMALAIPEVFGHDGVAFGLGYLLVTLVHAGLFRRAPGSSSRAILGIAPFNLASVLLVLTAGFALSPWKWALWMAAVGVVALTSAFRRESGFTLSPAHFVERHGLVIIVALGESIVAIGVGLGDRALSAPVLLAALLTLALSAALWWSYFDHDDHLAESALARAPAERRPRMALNGFGYGHYLMIAGIVLLASGVKLGVADPLRPEAAAAWNLGAGLALYLLGDVLYRRVVQIGPGRLRLVVAALMLLGVPLGLRWGTEVQLAFGVVLLVAMLMLEARRSPAQS